MSFRWPLPFVWPFVFGVVSSFDTLLAGMPSCPDHFGADMCDIVPTAVDNGPVVVRHWKTSCLSWSCLQDMQKVDNADRQARASTLSYCMARHE
ncbi:hypothetical protein QBC37DRAFT_421977 [Rhypophila decipiens]|uniref:Secreted protein n=1 Tax=Rhypophila decipiens TaxID=261697 RepID=A0AAN7B614_9PEZI|nr:hypothetical protein QBC37DRAFT_421977 [Rhypophila decipiens]